LGAALGFGLRQSTCRLICITRGRREGVAFGDQPAGPGDAHAPSQLAAPLILAPPLLLAGKTLPARLQ